MIAMTCQEVEALLDLFAADACDPPTRDAVQLHLRQCEACAASYAESQRVQGLLDVHLNKAGLERLQRHIAAEAQPRRKVSTYETFVRRAGLIAAVLLLAVGLIWWLPNWDGDRKPALEFALLVRAGKAKVELAPQIAVGSEPKDAEVIVALPAATRNGNTLRRDLLQAQREGKLPLPPAVFLELVLLNNSKRPVEVHLGDSEGKLWFEIPGEGVLRIAAPDADIPEALRVKTLQMDPGKQLVFHIERLVAGSPGKLEYVYFTEPGEYTLTPHLRLTADGRPLSVTGTTMRVKVGAKPADSP